MSVAALVGIVLALLDDAPLVQTQRGMPLNPLLVVREFQNYREQNISMEGSLYEDQGRWYITSMRISSGGGLPLRFASAQLLTPFVGTAFLPGREGGGLYFIPTCELRATGILSVDSDQPAQPYVLVYALEPASEKRP